MRGRCQHRDDRRQPASGPNRPGARAPAGAGRGGRVGESLREAPLPRWSVAL